MQFFRYKPNSLLCISNIVETKNQNGITTLSLDSTHIINGPKVEINEIRVDSTTRNFDLYEKIIFQYRRCLNDSIINIRPKICGEPIILRLKQVWPIKSDTLYNQNKEKTALSDLMKLISKQKHHKSKEGMISY